MPLNTVEKNNLLTKVGSVKSLLNAVEADSTAPAPPPPAPPPAPVPAPSPDGTRVPPASMIVDPENHVWTLSGQVYRNGVSMGWGTCLAIKLVDTKIWIQGDSTVWYMVNGTSLGYSQPNEPGVTSPPPPAPAPVPPPPPAPSPAPSPPAPPPPAPPTGELATLAPNTARVIGTWTEPVDQQDSSIGGQAGQRTTYSSVAYDRQRKRFLMRGGHHGPHISQNLRAIEVSPFRAYSIGENTLRENMTVANCDSTVGRWIDKNTPWSRHTYNSNFVAGDKFFMLGEQNSHNAANGVTFPPGPGKGAFFDLNTHTWAFSQASRSWLMDHAACLTPDGKFALVINRGQSAWGVPYLYSIETDTAQQLPFSFATPQGWIGSPCVVYYPPNGKFYAIEENGRVWEITLDPLNPAASTVSQAMPVGWPDTDPTKPYRLVRMGYDPINQRIAGSLWLGSFVSFDPIGRTWVKSTPVVEAGSSGVPSTEFWCADFDADSGCYISFEANGKCWAYRPPAASGVPAPAPSPVPPPTAPAPAPAPTGSLWAELDFGKGQVARFSGGVDLGTFHGEFVHQRCFLATDPAFPDWRVMFRPDEDGKRDEVVIEYGRATGGTPTNRMTPYTASIFRGNALVHRVVVPTHWWDARWRWQSAPRPLVRTPEQLVERGLIPKLGTTGLFNRAPYTLNGVNEGPMTLPAHMSTSMGSAGENQMIGHLTEAAAEYVIRRQPNHIATSLVEAEACATWQTHLRLADGTLPDIASGMHYIGSGVPGSTLNQAKNATHPEEVTEAESHWWPCANLPWLLTEDPYYLEEIQFGVNWRLLYNTYGRHHQKLGGIIMQQVRSWGWALRDIFLLASSTPEQTPKWLQPRSTWKRNLDDNRILALRHVNSTSAFCQRFRIWLSFRGVASWMTSFVNAAMGHGAKNFPEWKPIFEWGVAQHIAQIDGKSGWDERMPTPYFWYPLGTDRLDLGANGWPVTPNPELEAAAFTSWKAASDHTKSQQFPGQDTALWPPNEPKLIGQSYALQVRAALVMAVEHGVTDAQLCLDRLEGYIRGKGWDGMARFAFEARA